MLGRITLPRGFALHSTLGNDINTFAALHYTNILGAVDGPKNVSAVCTFRNPYIVVLVCTKSRHYPYERAKFADLISRVKPLQIPKSPLPQPGDFGIFCESSYLLPKKEISCNVLYQGKIAWVIDRVPNVLGAPILLNGNVVSLIVTPTGLNDSLKNDLQAILHGFVRANETFYEGGINPVLVDILPDFLLKELEIADSLEPEVPTNQQKWLIEKAFKAREAVGLGDGKAWFEEGHDIAILPQDESEIENLVRGSGELESNLDHFPPTVRQWILRRWNKDKILHDERETYLSSFCRGVIAAKEKIEADKRQAEEQKKRAEQKVRLVRTKLTEIPTLIK